MTTVLVLGASGFLGRHVCRVATRTLEAPRVIGVGRRQPRLPQPGLHEWRTVELSLASSADHLRLFKELAPDVVINCAGSTAGDAAELAKGNVTLVTTLVAALVRYGSSRLVHLGSAAEYGSQPAEVPIAESSDPHPVSVYGRTKLAATMQIVAAAEEGLLDATVLRVFNPIGSGASADSLAGRVAAALKRAAVEGVDTIRLGPLDASRDFIDADDVALSAVRAAILPDLPPLLNVGTGHATMSRALVHQLAAVAGYTGAIVEEDHGSSRSQAVDWQAADIKLLRHYMGWAPSTPLADSLRQLWEAQNAVTSGPAAARL